MWCIVVLARHSVCNLLSEIDSASAALLRVLVCTLCLTVTSVLDLVGLLRQLPACSVEFCKSQRSYVRTSDVAAAAPGCRL